jgi:hypothetical protein
MESGVKAAAAPTGALKTINRTLQKNIAAGKTPQVITSLTRYQY